MLFILIGLLLYLALYVVSEQLVYRHARQNRFYAVKSASAPEYDYVILGASHAAVLDYADMNAQLEQRTGSRVLNLSVVGAGVTVNRLLLDYFLSSHTTRKVIYVLDSFGFYSRQWNEDRLGDVQLYDRAPFDPSLAALLVTNSATRPIALDYIIGFSKINNHERFTPDITDDEALRFDATYRPIAQIDAQRLRFLYPEPVDDSLFAEYLAQFVALQDMLNARGSRLIAIKPPLPERVYRMLPNEGHFDALMAAEIAKHGGVFIDLTLQCNDESFFYNTDHLNRAGVLNFYDQCLVPTLTAL